MLFFYPIILVRKAEVIIRFFLKASYMCQRGKNWMLVWPVEPVPSLDSMLLALNSLANQTSHRWPSMETEGAILFAMEACL